jgi:hypothetical protein
MRTMYDSVTPTDIPTSINGRPPALVAGYIDGVPRWPDSAWARFPNSVHVRIALNPATNDGHVLDVEQGAAQPNQAPGWVQRRRAAGADPTVYCSQSLWPTVRAAFAAAGVAEPHWWIAAYPGPQNPDGSPALHVGAVAHQFADPITSGGHWDLSVVADYWPGVDTAIPAKTKDIDMGNWFAVSQGGNEVGSGLLLENGAFLGLPIPASVRAAQAYSNLNDGASDADAMGRWQDLVTRFGAEAKVMAPQVTVAINGQPQQAQLNPSTGHYELTLVPDAPAQH